MVSGCFPRRRVPAEPSNERCRPAAAKGPVTAGNVAGERGKTLQPFDERYAEKSLGEQPVPGSVRGRVGIGAA